MASVFLVDDHPDVSEVVGQLLKMHGHVVEVIHSGESALQQMETNTPQVVIADHRLPEMSGVELLQTIRANPQYKNVFCVLFSADENIRDLATQAGAHKHWLKGSDAVFDSIAGLQGVLDKHAKL